MKKKSFRDWTLWIAVVVLHQAVPAQAAGVSPLGIAGYFEDVFDEVVTASYWIAGILIILGIFVWWAKNQGYDAPGWVGRSITGGVIIASIAPILSWMGLSGATL